MMYVFVLFPPIIGWGGVGGVRADGIAGVFGGRGGAGAK